VVPPLQLEGDPLPPKADIRFLEPDMDMVKMVLKQDNVGWELQFHFDTKPEKHLNWLVEDGLDVFLDGARDDLHYWVGELMPTDVYDKCLLVRAGVFRPGL
jgi:hypothetical protein